MTAGQTVFEGTSYYSLWLWLEDLYDRLAGEDIDGFDDLFFLHDGRTVGIDADRHRLWWTAMTTITRLCATSYGHGTDDTTTAFFAALARRGVGVHAGAVAQLEAFDTVFHHVFATNDDLPADIDGYLRRGHAERGVMLIDKALDGYRSATTALTVAARVACVAHRELGTDEPLSLSSRAALMLLSTFDLPD